MKSHLKVVTGAVVGSALLLVSAPAQADTPLAFLGSSCHMEDTGPGWDNFYCTTSWTGGTGTVTADFVSANGWTFINSVDNQATRATAEGICYSSHTIAVTITLTDSASATVSKSVTAACH